MTSHAGTHRLTDMDLDFVSLVSAGDDPEAKVAILKAEPMHEPKAGAKCIGHKCDSKPTTAVTKADGKTLAACDSHKNLLQNLKGSGMSKSDPTNQNGALMGEISKEGMTTEQVAYLEALEAEVDTLGQQVEKSETDIAAVTGERDAAVSERDEAIHKASPEGTPEEIMKAALAEAPPALRAIIAKQQTDLAEAQSIAKAERDARLTREYIAKAEALPMLNDDAGDEKSSLATLLRAAATALSPEDNGTLEKVLKAANTQIAQGNLFSSIGKTGAETTVSKSVMSAAEEIKKSNPGMTIEQAEAQAYRDNPDLLIQAMTNQEV